MSEENDNVRAIWRRLNNWWKAHPWVAATISTAILVPLMQLATERQDNSNWHVGIVAALFFLVIGLQIMERTRADEHPLGQAIVWAAIWTAVTSLGSVGDSPVILALLFILFTLIGAFQNLTKSKRRKGPGPHDCEGCGSSLKKDSIRCPSCGHVPEGLLK